MKCWCMRRESAFQDKVTLREYCLECSRSEKTSSSNVHLQYLATLIPLGPGDSVECYQAGDRARYEGLGVIEEVSTDYREGGTVNHPVYRVRLRGDKEKWYTSVCLERVH